MAEMIQELWKSFDFSVAILVFVAYILTDGIYAYYTLAIHHKRPMAAANSSTLIHLLYAVGILSYVQNVLYVVPIALGSWVGTYIVISKHGETGSERMEA